HPGRVEAYFVLFDEAAAADDVGDAGRHLQLTLDDPVFDAAQLGRTQRRRDKPIAIELPDRGGQRRELRLDGRRQVGVLQTLENALPREVVVDLIVEGQRQKREAELGVRKHP